eukprot:3179402-Amphidinium_carterae.1
MLPSKAALLEVPLIRLHTGWFHHGQVVVCMTHPAHACGFSGYKHPRLFTRKAAMTNPTP